MNMLPQKQPKYPLTGECANMHTLHIYCIICIHWNTFSLKEGHHSQTCYNMYQL